MCRFAGLFIDLHIALQVELLGGALGHTLNLQAFQSQWLRVRLGGSQTFLFFVCKKGAYLYWTKRAFFDLITLSTPSTDGLKWQVKTPQLHTVYQYSSEFLDISKRHEHMYTVGPVSASFGCIWPHKPLRCRLSVHSLRAPYSTSI